MYTEYILVVKTWCETLRGIRLQDMEQQKYLRCPSSADLTSQARSATFTWETSETLNDDWTNPIACDRL